MGKCRAALDVTQGERARDEVSSRSLTRMNPRLSIAMPAAATFKRIRVGNAAGGDEQVRPRR